MAIQSFCFGSIVSFAREYRDNIESLTFKAARVAAYEALRFISQRQPYRHAHELRPECSSLHHFERKAQKSRF